VFSGEIKKVTRTGVVSTFAQLPGPHSGFSAVGLAMDEQDNVYVARATFNGANTGVYRISADGSNVTFFTQMPVGIPNGLAFGDDGALFVSDSLAGSIWRIDRNGHGSIWVQDALLAGEAGPPLGIPVGANGIAFDKGRKNLYVAVTDLGRIVRIPVNKETGAAGAPSVFVENLAMLKGSDGIAFDVQRNLYVTVNRQDRFVRINSAGAIEVLAEGGLLDFPATPAFGKGRDEGTIFLTNFALFRARGFVPGAPSPKIVKINVGIPGAELGD
jgi:sugar lactone lactonase YvrE